MRVNLAGRAVGRLTVIEPSNRTRYWACVCECGEPATVRHDHLVHERVKSCGCFRRSAGGMHQSRTHKTWDAMIQRCTNPRHKSYERYGERGIAVCERWRSFAAFVADMGERPTGRTLDRRNNEGSYSPENCRWATPAEQMQNKSNTRLSPDKVSEIRLRRAAGETYALIGKGLGVSVGVVRHVVTGHTWKNIK